MKNFVITFLAVILFSTITFADSTNDNNAQTNSSGSNTQITGGYTSTTTNNNDGQTNTTTNTTSAVSYRFAMHGMASNVNTALNVGGSQTSGTMNKSSFIMMEVLA